VFPINLRDLDGGILADLRRPQGYLTLLLLLVATQLPVILSPEYVHMLVLTFVIGTAAIAWNIIGGYGGQFSLGNAMFFGIGAYTLGILLVRYETSYLLAVIAAIGLALVAAVIVGYPSFQLTGHYFALATITIVEGLRFLARYLQDLTGGAQGMSLVPAMLRGVGPLGYTRGEYYLPALGLFTFTFLVSVWVRRTKIGYYLMALREDQLAAASLGINVARYKMYGWLVSAALTAMAGVLYATYNQFLDPDFSFSITQSVLYAVIPIIGGIGTIAGPVVGAVLMVPLEHFVVTEFGGEYGAITYMVYGISLVLLIILAPEGLVPKFRFVGERIVDRLPTFESGREATEVDESERTS